MYMYSTLNELLATVPAHLIRSEELLQQVITCNEISYFQQKCV